MNVFRVAIASCLVARVAAAETPAIILPDPVAVTLPAGQQQIGADDAMVQRLIAAARAGGYTVRLELPREHLGVGIWPVVWSAWADPAASFPVARREAALAVLPTGMTLIAITGNGNATGGNNAAHLARDHDGFLHMVWTAAFAKAGGTGAMYRRGHDGPDGTLVFDTDAESLARHDGGWTSMPALAAAGDMVHFAWQHGGTIWYRNVKHSEHDWIWSEETDTKVPSTGRDTGPAITVNQRAVHILAARSGLYARSADLGLTWQTEQVPFGPENAAKTVSLTLDRRGRPVAAASVVVAPGTAQLSEDRGHGAYWPIRLFRRTGEGQWKQEVSPTDAFGGWHPSQSPAEDVLADWVRVVEDPSGGLHLTWHGTAVSRIYGNDRSYYAWRPDGEDWREPVSLREPDPRRGYGWSYAPAMALRGDLALVLTFYDTTTGRTAWGFDSDLLAFRDGRPIGARLPVTRFAWRAIATGNRSVGMATWFPGLASETWRDANGGVWGDVLMALQATSVRAPVLIVHQRVDLRGFTSGGVQ